ncbi:uncharacterized protein LOC134274181 [Saccostrea cucullata]|uniref:uncharacterized protein LOC134274181 n=1 Tax=Saccostrea cuccullata TaxID=36930 RepID=UPI002ED14283
MSILIPYDKYRRLLSKEGKESNICVDCHKAFSRKDVLLRHRKRQHELKPISPRKEVNTQTSLTEDSPFTETEQGLQLEILSSPPYKERHQTPPPSPQPPAETCKAPPPPPAEVYKAPPPPAETFKAPPPHAETLKAPPPHAETFQTPPAPPHAETLKSAPYVQTPSVTVRRWVYF